MNSIHHDHDHAAAAGGGGDEHAGHDMSSMDHGGSSDHAGHDMSSMDHGGSSDHAGHDMGHRRRRSLLLRDEEEEEERSSGKAANANSGGSGKIHFSDDPLDLSNEMPTDYRNWASILSQVLLAKEQGPGAGGGGGGDFGEARAIAALDGLTLATRARLARAASGDAEPLFPRFHLTDPIFHSMDQPSDPGNSTNPGGSTMTGHSGHSMGEGMSMISGVHAMSSFINYAPCVLGVRERNFFSSSSSFLLLLLFFLFFWEGEQEKNPRQPPCRGCRGGLSHRKPRNEREKKETHIFTLFSSSLSPITKTSGARRRGHGRDDGAALRAVAAERDALGVRGQGRGRQLRAEADLYPGERARVQGSGREGQAFLSGCWRVKESRGTERGEVGCGGRGGGAGPRPREKRERGGEKGKKEISLSRLTSSPRLSETKTLISADGRECATAGSKRPGAFYLCFCLGRRKREINAKRGNTLIFYLRKLPQQQQPALIYIGPMGANVQPQGVNIQVRGGFIFPLFVTLRCSLFFLSSHTNLLTSFCPAFLSPLQNKNTAYPRLCDACRGNFIVSRALERGKTKRRVRENDHETLSLCFLSLKKNN